MIKIGKAKIEVIKDKAVLTCEVHIDDEKREIFYEIDKKYKDYLCTERSDAFIVAAVYYAMKHHHDISCDVPMTSSIYYGLTTYLIPTLAKHSNILTNININVPLTDEVLENRNEVGTGMSCGIDSFHTLKNYLNPEIPSMKLTCLFLNNVGSFKAYSERYKGMGSDAARDKITAKAERVAKEVKLPLIVTNSNIHVVFEDVYYRIHTFANMFSVLLMQKFLSKYYYASSGYDLAYYNVIDSPELDSAEYDLLMFYSLSTPNLRIYSEGAEKTRLEKTIDIADFKPAQNNLHVCIKNSENCGQCLKCKRTLVALEAIDKLDSFKKVFDVEYYKNHKKEYYDWLDNEAKEDSEMNKYTWYLLRQKQDKTEYKDIEDFNKKNIIIPKTYVESLSIKNHKKYILNKNSETKYSSDLYYRLYSSLELAKRKNEKIKIPKYILKNNSFNITKPKTIKRKIKYLKQLLRRRTREVELHNLIYFILYKPEVSKQIIKYLVKSEYIKKLNSTKLNKHVTTKSLVNIFEEAIENKIIEEALTDGFIKHGKNKLKNDNIFTNCKNRYYINDDYKIICLEKKNNRYIFAGKINDYCVSAISKYTNKNDIYEDIASIYGIIKRLIEK